MPTQLRRAIDSACSGFPAVFTASADVLNGGQGTPLPDASAGVPHAAATVSARPPTDACLRTLVKLIEGARRPLVLAGQGALIPERERELALMADDIGAVLGTTLLARELFAAHPDLVLSFGASLNPFMTGAGTLFCGIPVVSLDPRQEQGRSSPVATHQVRADALQLAMSLRSALAAAALRRSAPSPRSADLRRQLDDSWHFEDVTGDHGLDLQTVVTMLNEVLPADCAVIPDSGKFATVVGRYIRVSGAHSLPHTTETGSIGLGLGIAMGAAARPQRTHALFAGGGGLSMALQKLATSRAMASRW
jgi:acetolactate synthase-1/2/3 large subunit